MLVGDVYKRQWLEILFIRIVSMQIAITQFTTAAMGNSGAKHPCYSAL